MPTKLFSPAFRAAQRDRLGEYKKVGGRKPPSSARCLLSPADESLEGLVPVSVEDLRAELQEQMRAGPLHLLLLDHPFAHHLVDRGLDETDTDPFSSAIPFAIVDDEPGVISDIQRFRFECSEVELPLA